jgi:hypothetical protein
VCCEQQHKGPQHNGSHLRNNYQTTLLLPTTTRETHPLGRKAKGGACESKNTHTLPQTNQQHNSLNQPIHKGQTPPNTAVPTYDTHMQCSLSLINYIYIYNNGEALDGCGSVVCSWNLLGVQDQWASCKTVLTPANTKCHLFCYIIYQQDGPRVLLEQPVQIYM